LPAATNLVPSAEEAIETQFVLGALVCVQVWAKVGLGAVNMAPTAATFSKRKPVFMAGV
jgi:hypothetical protein